MPYVIVSRLFVSFPRNQSLYYGPHSRRCLVIQIAKRLLYLRASVSKRLDDVLKIQS
jgi:hypothetical protein